MNRFLCCLAAALLGGCGGLTRNAEPERIYVLAPAAGSGAPAVNAVLLLPRPVMQPGLDTDRIALSRPGHELNYYAGSRWGESLPKVVGALAAQMLGDGAGFATVLGPDRAHVSGDFEMLLTVRHFEARGGDADAPAAQVVIDCVLTAGMPRRVLGRCDGAATVPAVANRQGEIIAALESAAQRALTQVRDNAVALARRGDPVAAGKAK
jgi:ABC-type uncharacterized transport system auxiliary subunit